jgi:hypothetical protein
MTSENMGARVVDEVTVNVTALTNADNEPLSTWTDESDIDVVENATVVGHDDKTHLATVDDQNEQVTVVVVADGTDAGAGTDVGSITLRLEGRR